MHDIVEIRECFDMFDIDQDGRISADEIATMTRALGQNPTDAEVLDMLQQVDKDGEAWYWNTTFVYTDNIKVKNLLQSAIP